MTIIARYATPKASQYLQQLCKHFGHKVPATFNETHGEVELPLGRCVLDAADGVLTMACIAKEPEGEVRLVKVVAVHLERFAWKDGTPAKTHAAEGLANHTVWGACFHPDGTLVACIGGNSGHLLFWGPNDEKPAHKFDLPVQARGLDFHAATQQLATVHHDGHLRLTALGGSA